MSFRARLLLSMLGLVAVSSLATLLGLEVVVRREVVLRLESDLGSTRDALAHQLERDLSRLQTEAKVAAEEPRLKALLNTDGIDVDTLEDVADETRRAAGWDLLALSTADRTVETLTGGTSKQPVAEGALFDGALEKGETRGYWMDGATLYRGAAKSVRFGNEAIGALVVADRLDDARVTELGARGRIVFALFDGTTLVASPFADPQRREALARAAAGKGGLDELRLGGESFLARELPLEGTAIRAVVLESEEAALAPYRRLRFGLLGVGGGALVLALAFGTLLSRGLSRPLSVLAQSAQQVGAGKLDTRVELGTTRELRSLGQTFNTMVEEIARSREELRRNEALRRELEIAHAVQTGVLPHDVRLPGFGFAAKMRPAAQVGGDYYEVIPTKDGGFWILVGDVSGHGLSSGLLMLILQSAALSAITATPELTPRALIAHLNRVLHAEVLRMKSRHYATLMALRYEGNGAFVAAGGHQPVFVARAQGGVEVIEVQGPWCGLMPEVSASLSETRIELRPGEWLWLVTDGVLEAQNDGRELFGEERMTERVKAAATRAPPDALESVFVAVDAFCPSQTDDMTVVALRRDDEESHG